MLGPRPAALVSLVVLACSSGSGSLDRSPQDLSCVDAEVACGNVCIAVDNDPAHCGACDVVCAASEECSAGRCVCAAPRVDCDVACVDTQTDVNHCGGCGIACPPGQACVVGACNGGVACEDTCPVPGGVTWGCRTRFMYGTNYAWASFGADFGGIGPWQEPGVAANDEIVSSELGAMSAAGASVVRWWVWPEFRSEALSWEADGTPRGLGGSVLLDLQRALELAEQHDVYLMLCLFSFDNFRREHTEGNPVPSLRPVAADPAMRQALVDNFVRPFARAAESSPYRNRLIAWDVINEPEGAIHGSGLHGSPAFDEWVDDPVTPDQMEAFITEVITGLRQESTALVTVGSTAIGYRAAWQQLDVDFYQFHIYDWVQDLWPYSRSPAQYGVADKPVVMGEFPTGGITVASYPTLLGSWFSSGYAGALSWQYRDNPNDLGEVRAFADAHPCETRY